MSKPVNKKNTLVQVRGLKKYFRVKNDLFQPKNYLKAVDDVSFDIYEGETFGLVGESGCGKSTLGRTLLRLYEPTGGEIIFNGEDITKVSEKGMLKHRKDMQMIFQDPYASLNTRMTIAEIIGEGMEVHTNYQGEAKMKRIYELLERVGLKREHANRYPHEFSGGQRQRVGIARALAIEPKFIVCDEPISALDVSIQAQVVNMLEELQEEFGLTYLFIAHDLSMVRHISDRIGVMYLGKLMELTTSDELYDNPLHPYAQALLSAIPIPDPRADKSQRIMLEGELKSPINTKPGCLFCSRCRYKRDECETKTPELKEVLPGHFVACHFVKEINSLV